MTLRNLLRLPTRFLRKSARALVTQMHSLKYRFVKNPNSSDVEFVANLLVVKKPIYANIAKICVESFYFYNPKCKVIVHVDSYTQINVQKSLKRLIKRGVVRVKKLNSNMPTWQEQKLDLVLSMNRENEFFMDADLRWNGNLPLLKEITYFVKEFDFSDREPYGDLVNHPLWTFGNEISMKNTSFVFWRNYQTTDLDRELIRDVMNSIERICNEHKSFAEHKDSLMRISEQIALSVLADKLEKQISYLKFEDGLRDGSFVESSYFGATGSAF